MGCNCGNRVQWHIQNCPECKGGGWVVTTTSAGEGSPGSSVPTVYVEDSRLGTTSACLLPDPYIRAVCEHCGGRGWVAWDIKTGNRIRYKDPYGEVEWEQD